VSQVEQRVTRSGPGCLVQLLWFIVVGWWAGQIWLLLAWLINLTIIGLPVGLWMLNRMPQVVLLREPATLTTVVRTTDGRLVLRQSELPQYSWVLRALYFLLIGWWFSFIWLEVAWLLCATILLFPVGIGMFASSPKVVSLRRT
jgi:uncharacterized membrane protein YccF (DUF307 family)